MENKTNEIEDTHSNEGSSGRFAWAPQKLAGVPQAGAAALLSG